MLISFLISETQHGCYLLNGFSDIEFPMPFATTQRFGKVCVESVLGKLKQAIL